MTQIAYLGGGNMAQAMARRHLAAGHAVTIYNRTPGKLAALEAAGATLAASPRAAVAGAEIVFASVTDDAASRAVWTGPEGALAGEIPAGALLVEHSTLSYDWVAELSGAVDARGLRYVDCPVAGRPDAAAAGQLIVFAGAAPADLDELTPYIKPLSKEIFRFGPPGAGTAFKLIYNLMGVVQIVALAEGLAAAEAAGIDPLTAATAFAHGNTGSGHVIKHGPFMAAGRHEDPPGFTARGRLKDSTYGVALEERLGLSPGVGRAAMAAYQEMVDLGLAGAADSRLIDVIRGRLSGTLRPPQTLHGGSTMPEPTDRQGAAANDRGLSAAARLRAILGGSAGNLVEWYDWYVYSAFTLYFAAVFFPAGDQTAQLLQAAAVFAVGFAARPVGAWLMGLYADRKGRKSALTLSVAMMCLGSLIVAVTPGAATIGVAAPVILVLARIFQGLSVGGEYGASATYLSEMAAPGSRGFWSSFQAATMIGGQLTALAVLIVLQHSLDRAELAAWGWRIPFVIGGALAVFMYWLRSRLDETTAFEAARAADAERASAALMWLKHPRASLTILGISAAGSLSFYIYTTYMQKFLANTAGFTKVQATAISAAALVGFMLMQPLFGWLSDRFGRKPLLIFAFGGGGLTLAPIMSALAHSGSAVLAFALILFGMTFVAAYTAVGGIVKAELFPTHLRALGVALPYALANATFGGTAEYVALWFKSTGHEYGFYIYTSAILALGLLVVLTLRETRRDSLDDAVGDGGRPREGLRLAARPVAAPPE